MSALELNNEILENVVAMELLATTRPLSNVIMIHLAELRRQILLQQEILSSKNEPAAAPAGNELIVMGLSESEDDEEFVRDLLEKADKPAFLPCTVTRLEKPNTVKTPAHLLLALESEDEAHDILRNLQNNGVIDSLGKGISISRNLNREEQEKQKEAHRKVKDLNKGLECQRYYYDRITFEVVDIGAKPQ
uniref:RRM domain-containing protein n=1 Tax=Steinernema glaseri TaxID=37863 RepID=A0A1I8AE04_9BILA